MPGIQSKTSAQHLESQVFKWRYLLPDCWLLWCWFFILWLITRLPYRWIVVIGRSLGVALFHLIKSRRRIALRNLELCVPELSPEERYYIARESFAGAGLTLFESGLVWWPRRGSPGKYVRVENAELLDRLAGKPVLFFGLHNTCVEIVYACLAQLREFHVLFRVNNNPLWEYMATLSRKRYGVTLVPRKQVREFVAHLSEGGAGLLAADQDLGRKRSVFVPFFSVNTATVTSVHEFSRQSGAQVVFAHAYRDLPAGYVLKLQLLDDFPSNDVISDTARMNQVIEAAVREHPDQYLWMHKRFKTRPEGEPDLYSR